MLTPNRTGTLSRGPLRAAWLTGAALVGLAVAGAGDGRMRHRAALGVAVTGLTAVPGVVQPRRARRLYLGWERWSGRCAQALTTYVAWVTHHTAFPAGADTERDGRRPTRRSAWQPHPASDEALASSSAQLLAGGWRPLQLRAWLRQSGRPRATWLAVCLSVLRWVRPGDGAAVPAQPSGDVYTLY